MPGKKKPGASRKGSAARKRPRPAKAKLAKKKAPAPKAGPAVASGPAGRRFWLVKTEPDVFSFADLGNAPGATTFWDGVRNYQARNYLRDQMQVGDGVFVYHSNAEPTAIIGVAEVARAGYPDHTQFERGHIHFDPDAKPEAPTWFMVDIRAVRPLRRPLTLAALREVPGLEKMVLLQKGSRLSVQPVSPYEWEIITRLGDA